MGKILEYVIIGIRVVAPICFILIIGGLLKKLKLLTSSSINDMNKIIFRVFTSSLLFKNIYDIKNINFEYKFMLYPIIFIPAMIFVSWIIFKPFVKKRTDISVLIQGAYRSNFVLYGIPIAESLYGNEGLQVVAMLPIVVIPLFNAFAVIILELYSGTKINFKKIFIGTIKNPLIIASILAGFFLLSGIKIPYVAYKTISDFAKIATPLAFVVLGASLELKSIIKHFKYIVATNILRLFIFPLIILTIAHYIGYNKLQMVAYFAVVASPTAISSFTMAKEMNANSDLAAEIVASTSVFSIISIFLMIVLLKSLAWI